MNIRAYHSTDAEAISALFYASVVALGARDYTPEQVEAWASRTPTPEDVQARCSDRRTVLVSTYENGSVVAYGDLEPDGHIDHLYCLPEAAGKGIASALYDELEIRARKAGLSRLYTEASEPARRLFLHKGFVLLHKRTVEINHVLIHNYAMEKKLL